MKLLGEVTRNGEAFEVRFERILATDLDDAWQAVTTRDRLERWMNLYLGDLRLGGEWQAPRSDGSIYATGTVTACDPPTAFTTSWQVVGEAVTTLSVTLEEVPGGTRMRLLHVGADPFQVGPGWQTYLEQLDDELGTGPGGVVDPDRPPHADWEARFTELQAGYAERLRDSGLAT